MNGNIFRLKKSRASQFWPICKTVFHRTNVLYISLENNRSKINDLSERICKRRVFYLRRAFPSCLLHDAIVSSLAITVNRLVRELFYFINRQLSPTLKYLFLINTICQPAERQFLICMRLFTDAFVLSPHFFFFFHWSLYWGRASFSVSLDKKKKRQWLKATASYSAGCAIT